MRIHVGLVAALWLLAGTPVQAHTLYLAMDDHTDYGWNFTTAQYDQAMLEQLDYYLDRISTTAGNPAGERTRFNADCWYYVRLYQENRSQVQFDRLIAAMAAGQVVAPLNPLVTLYGALPTEAAIRGGYYPGRLERQYGVTFSTALDIENHTNPWGLSQLWRGSNVLYSWKGICNCTGGNSPLRPVGSPEVFRWRGPDNRDVILKWYVYQDNAGVGGYAEVRNNQDVGSQRAVVAGAAGRNPSLPVTGLFGVGWDDLSSRVDVADVAAAFNADAVGRGSPDRAVASNEVDFFEAVLAAEQAGTTLPVLRGGFGNDWDLWPASLAERTGQTRRAVEQLRIAEALGVLVEHHTPGFWASRADALDHAWVDFFKYYEHTWGNAGAVTLQSVINNKKAWAQSFVDTVNTVDTQTMQAAAALFTAPAGSTRVVVFNALDVGRDDVVTIPVAGAGPYVVRDVASGNELLSQPAVGTATPMLRVAVTNVPSTGYRTLEISSGSPTGGSVATFMAGARTFTSTRWSMQFGVDGSITGMGDLANGVQTLVGAGFNQCRNGNAACGGTASFAVEEDGPVQTVLRVDVPASAGVPARSTRVTLFANTGRVELENTVGGNFTGELGYRFVVAPPSPQIRFEELGAVARPGLTPTGDFLPGTRADYMTLNHFVHLQDANYGVAISNTEAFAMRVGNSTPSAFDVPTNAVTVLALGNPAQAGITNQGGDTAFVHHLAIHGLVGGYDGATTLRAALMHTTPLRAIPLTAGNTGPRTAPNSSLLGPGAASTVLTAFKPAEDAAGQYVVRLWEMNGLGGTVQLQGAALNVATALETSLIETDLGGLGVQGSLVDVPVTPLEMKTVRLVPAGGGGSSSSSSSSGSAGSTSQGGASSAASASSAGGTSGASLTASSTSTAGSTSVGGTSRSGSSGSSSVVSGGTSARPSSSSGGGGSSVGVSTGSGSSVMAASSGGGDSGGDAGGCACRGQDTRAAWGWAVVLVLWRRRRAARLNPK